MSRHLRQRRSRRHPLPFRLASFEPLESRFVLTSPTLAAISDVSMYSGMPMYIALDGYDADGDTLSYTATSSNGSLTTSVPEGNHSLRMTVEGYGVMEFELFEDGAPNTTARIMELVNSGFYDGLTFHRIIKDFMIQGGDPDGDGTGGSGTDFDDEYNPDLLHSCAGVLSMAKSADDTNDSQFFITSTATHYLDYQHTVFGFLTEGDDVREEIESVTVSGSTPTSSVVIESMDVFTDYENGVLVLKAADGFTGTATVTVTVSDGQGGTAQRTFNVTVAAAPTLTTDYSRCYMSEIDPITITAGESYSFTIPAQDPDGNAIYYSAQLATTTSAVTVSTSSTTGATTLTTTPAATGTYSLKLRVASSASNLTASSSYYHDTQYVTVNVVPADLAAPTLDLLTSSDTGLSDSDNITSLDNSDSDSTLSFRVSDVTSGAKVYLYVDGGTTAIGQATASGTQVIVETNGTVDLSNGTHSFRAVQVLSGVTSDSSEELAVTIDTSTPAFTSSPSLTAAQGRAYVYDADTDEEEDGNVSYTLQKSVAGMTVDEDTGVFTWTPTANALGNREITLRATDQAGHYVEQTFQISVGAGPLITTIANQTVEEGQTLSLTVEAEDELTPLVFSLDDAPGGATINADTGAFTWTTDESDGPGNYTVTVAVANSDDAVSYVTFTVTVTEKNTSPQLDAIDACSIAEGQTLTVQAVATDADLPANTLEFSLAAGAPDGAAIDEETGEFTWTPTETQGPGEYQVTIVVRDSAGATATSSFTVTVQEVESAPVFDSLGAQTVTAGQTLRLTVHAEDPDLPNPNAVQYSLDSGAPEGAAIDATTGQLVWPAPEGTGVGVIELVVRATEVVSVGDAASSTMSIFVQVKAAAPLAEEVTPENILDARIFAQSKSQVEFLPLQPQAFDWLLSAPRVNNDVLFGSGTFLSEVYEDYGLLGPRLAAHGASHAVRQSRVTTDRIDAPGEPAEEGVERTSLETPIDGGSMPAENRQSLLLMPETTDRALEALAQESEASPDDPSAEAAPEATEVKA